MTWNTHPSYFRAALQPLLRLLMDSLGHLVLLFGLLWCGTGTLGFWIRAMRYQGVPACEEVSATVAKPVLGDFFDVCDSVASLCRLNSTYVSNPKLPHLLKLMNDGATRSLCLSHQFLGGLGSMSAIMVVRAWSLESWVVCMRACQPTTKKNSLSCGRL